MTTALTTVIERIAKLRTHTTDKGATPQEADTFALQIGRIIMANPALQITAGTQAQARRKSNDFEWIVLEECHLHRKTEKAGFFSYHGLGVWIPKSLIDFGNSYIPGGQVRIRRWFFEKEIEPQLRGLAGRGKGSGAQYPAIRDAPRPPPGKQFRSHGNRGLSPPLGHESAPAV